MSLPTERKPVAEAWAKTEIVAVYDAAAATYNRVGPSFFSYFAELLTDGAEITAESRVLDVATGSGAVLLRAAARVGRRGSVTGVDLSPRMLERAADEIRTNSLTNCDLLLGDADHLPVADLSFDRVLCSFAVFLLPDLRRALSEFHRVLAPSGKVGLAYSAGADDDWRWYDELLAEYGASADLGTERYDSRTIEATLAQTGFTSIASHVEVCHLVFADADEWWGWAWSHGDRAALGSLSGDLGHSKRRALAEFRTRAGGDGLRYRVPGTITFGTKPISDSR